MKMKFGAALIALAILFPAISVAAKVPAKTGEFVNYCKARKHHDDCFTEMMADEVSTSLSANLNGDRGECQLPRGISGIKGNEEILAWLARHNDYDAAPLHDGIQAAIKGLWNCAETLHNGKTSSGAPDKAGAFLAFCGGARNYNICADEIVSDDMKAYAGAAGLNPGYAGHCSAPKGVETKEMTGKVLAWLRANPQQPDGDTEAAVMTAIDSLWPCH